MDQPPEHEEKNAVPEGNKKPSGSKHAEDGKTAKVGTPPPKDKLILLKLKLIANYAMHGSPVLAVLALIIAVIAVAGNLSSQAQLSVTSGKLESVNASLSASKVELEKLKASIAQGKAMQEEQHKKQDEVVSEIIRNVTNLQIKMKIYPTLEEQLIQPANTNSKS